MAVIHENRFALLEAEEPDMKIVDAHSSRPYYKKPDDETYYTYDDVKYVRFEVSVFVYAYTKACRNCINGANTTYTRCPTFSQFGVDCDGLNSVLGNCQSCIQNTSVPRQYCPSYIMTGFDCNGKDGLDIWASQPQNRNIVKYRGDCHQGKSYNDDEDNQVFYHEVKKDGVRYYYRIPNVKPGVSLGMCRFCKYNSASREDCCTFIVNGYDCNGTSLA